MNIIDKLNTSTNILSSDYKIGTTLRDFHEIRELISSPNIEVITLTGTAVAIGYVSAGKTISTSSLPNNLVGFVSLSEESNRELEEISKHWELHGRKLAPPCYLIKNDDDAEHLSTWLVDQIIVSSKHTAIRNVTLMRELTHLRVAHEESQRAFYTLERYVEANLQLKRNLAVTLESSSQSLELNKKCNKVTQLLPTVSVGVSDIGFHISSLPKDMSGSLKASLYAIESGRQVGNWVLPTASLSKNWIQLALAKTLGVDEESLSLTLEWTGSDVISVSLGTAHPDQKWRAVANGTPTNRTLAIKVWRSLPDTAPTLSPRAFKNQSENPEGWLVDSDALKNAQCSSHKEYVNYIDEADALLVHPIGTAPIIAKLSRCAPKGTKQISALIESVNKDATLIEYAIAVALPKSADDQTVATTFNSGYISEWIVLSGGSKSQIHLFLPTALENTGDVYLITRIRPGTTNENCWAHFKNIKVVA